MGKAVGKLSFWVTNVGDNNKYVSDKSEMTVMNSVVLLQQYPFFFAIFSGLKSNRIVTSMI